MLSAGLLWTISLVLQFNHHYSAAADSNVIHVRLNGTSDSSCWTGREELACSSVQLALVGLETRYHSKDTTIFVHGPGVYTLPANTTATVVSRASNVAVTGSGNKTVIECLPGAGLAFLNSSNVSLSLLTLRGCGRTSVLLPSGKSDTLRYHAAAVFVQCTDVQLLSLSITESTGHGVFVDNCDGTVTVVDSWFMNNSPEHGNGGGMVLQHNTTNSVIVEIADCVFINNTANTTHTDFEDVISTSGRGGGLAVLLQNKGRVSVVINKCDFKNNTATHGGGLYILYNSSSLSHGNNVVITASTFTDNSCFSLNPHDSQGGGVGIVYSADVVKTNNIVLSWCNFTNNDALFGGGLSVIFSQASNVTDGYLQISDCIFEGNGRLVGYAFHSCSMVLVTHSIMPCIIVSDTDFSNNHLIKHHGLTDGLGAVSSDKIPLCLHGNIAFVNNTGTALVMSVSTVTISDNSSVVFTNNTGHNGGAVSLLNTALLILGQNIRLLFTENRAYLFGGAVYVGQFGYQSKLGHTSCFLQYNSDPYLHPSKWNVSVVFENNTASDQDNSIYAPTILPCVWYTGNSTKEESVRQTFCWDNWVFQPTGCTQQVRTAVACITPPSISQLQVYPGEAKKLTLNSSDDYQHDISESSLFSARFTKDNADTLQYISNNTVTAYGQPGMSDSLVLDTLAPRVIHSVVNVTFLPCPPGFILSNNTFHSKGDDDSWSTCVCGQGFRYTVHCQPTEFKSYLHWGSFLTYDETNNVVVGGTWTVIAPKTNKSKDGYNLLPQDLYKLNEFTCGPINRQGYLCDKCIANTSAPVNSLSLMCVNCSKDHVKYNWVFFIVQEIIPATIFFAVVIIFNISATSGPANAYVFFAQMVTNPLTVAHYSSQLSHVFPEHEWAVKLLLGMFILPYSIWNLDFFAALVPPYCIARHMKTIDTFALQYLLAFYPLVLLCITYVCIELHARGCRLLVWMWKPAGYCIGRWRRNWEVKTSIIDTFATFFLLGYNKFSLVSFFMLIPMHTYDHTGAVIGPPRVFCDMSVEYASTKHIYLMVFALLVIIFLIILPPIFLLVYPLKFFQKFIIRCHIDSNAVRTFVDAFQGSYKDGTNGSIDCRFFASFYFILRIASFCTMSATTDLVLLRLIQLITLLVFLSAMALLRPYKNEQYNTIDLFILALLSLVLTFAFYNAAVPNGDLIINIFLMVCTVVPLVFMIWLVSRHLWRQIKIRRRVNWSSHNEARSLLEASDQMPDRVINPGDYK